MILNIVLLITYMLGHCYGSSSLWSSMTYPIMIIISLPCLEVEAHIHCRTKLEIHFPYSKLHTDHELDTWQPNQDPPRYRRAV